MFKFIQIQRAILSLGPGEYQRLCSEYIIKKRGICGVTDYGSKEGTNKTTRGIPDAYFVDENQKYTLLMYGTVEKQSITKLINDIQDACDSEKTGIRREQIKEVICIHTNTNIKPGDHDNLINLIPNIKITLIDVDTLAHDIDENYSSIANELNIVIDTNQISDIDTFIERYDKSSINSPLKIDFVYRKEKDSIYKIIKESKMTVISGKPGNGKTKICLEVLKEFEQKEEYVPLCIRINGLELYNDIKTAIEGNKKYIIFIDDINNLNGLQYIIDTIITTKNENIKILATVRDYLLDEVEKRLNSCIEPSVFILNKMEDSEIISILENTYNLKDKAWQQKILKISNGNPRLAIMSFVSVRDGKIDSLNSVYDVFKNYYDEVFNQKKLSQHEIDILFYISLLSPISTSNEVVSKIFNDLLIYDVEVFKKLRDIELIDYYKDDALKICDQNFANYLIYKYLIVNKTIKISDLLKKIYPNFISKFVNMTNMINEQFYDEDAYNYITSEIDSVWELEPYNKDWRFMTCFHNVNIPKSLLKIKEKIDSYDEEEIPEEVKYDNNVYISDDLLSLISDFKNTEYLKLSFELLLLYLDKKPRLYNEVCKSIKDYWLIKNLNPDFLLETEIINILFSKYKMTTTIKMKEIYKILLEQSLLYCLELNFHLSEEGNRPRMINFITLKLQEKEEVFEFRRKLYDIIFELCSEGEKNYTLLLNNNLWHYSDEQKEILRSDIQYLDMNFFSKWGNISIIQSKILFLLKEKCQKFDIETPVSLEKYKKCQEFVIINMLEKYDYHRQNNELIQYLKKNKKNCYDEIFCTLKRVEEQHIKVDEWKIYNSLAILFRYVLENDKVLFENIFILYLELDCPFVNQRFLIGNLLETTVIEKMLDNIIKSSTSKKYYLLACILNNYCDKKYITKVKEFIKRQNNMKNKYTLSIEAILEYSKFDKDLLENYTKEILAENKVELYAGFTSLFGDKEFAKIIFDAFNDKKILEMLYLNSIQCDSDCEGELGFLLCINNYDFLGKILEKESYNHTGKVRNILENIWRHDNYKEIISYNYDNMIAADFGYLRVNMLFEVELEEELRNNQLEWFKEKILEYKEDKEKIYYLFYVICEKDDIFKRELIVFLIDNTNDIEIFKSVSLFPRSEFWTGSRIPIIESKVDFIQSILNEIKVKNDLMYIYHIQYLNETMNIYRKQIEKTRIKEYIEDLLN